MESKLQNDFDDDERDMTVESNFTDGSLEGKVTESVGVGEDNAGSQPAAETTRNFHEAIKDDVALTFPQRLLEILGDESATEIIAWLPHGRAFVIYRKKEFESTVLPKYFHKQSKYSSFTRKLNRWGFVRVTRGPETGAYYHPLFKRGDHRLVMQMSCHSTASKKTHSTGSMGPLSGPMSMAHPQNFQHRHQQPQHQMAYNMQQQHMHAEPHMQHMAYMQYQQQLMQQDEMMMMRQHQQHQAAMMRQNGPPGAMMRNPHMNGQHSPSYHPSSHQDVPGGPPSQSQPQPHHQHPHQNHYQGQHMPPPMSSHMHSQTAHPAIHPTMLAHHSYPPHFSSPQKGVASEFDPVKSEFPIEHR